MADINKEEAYDVLRREHGIEPEGKRFLTEIRVASSEDEQTLNVSLLWDVQLAFTLSRDARGLSAVLSSFLESMTKASGHYYEMHQKFCDKGCLDRHPYVCEDAEKWKQYAQQFLRKHPMTPPKDAN